MKAGDLVEFNSGLFGLNHPQNIAIVIGRETQKKRVYVKLFTVRGKQETKAANLTKRKFNLSVEMRGIHPPPDNEMLDKLKEWIQLFGRKDSKMAQKAQKQITERALWDKLVENDKIEPLKTHEIASIWHEKDIPTKKEQSEINDLLQECSRPGYGYFNKVDERPIRWNPITPEEFSEVNEEIEKLYVLRKAIIETVVGYDPEDPEIETIEFVPIPLNEAGLTEEQEKLLGWIQDIMEFFVKNDTWPNQGLGKAKIRAIDGFQLSRFIKMIADEWTTSNYRRMSNAFVEFLIKSNRWDKIDALITIGQRSVLERRFFDWETPSHIEKLADAFKEPSETPEELERRTDLRELEAYTIDPATAKDFDDAISYAKNEDGSLTLWVHIADVAHYVEKDSVLDKHAKDRATSVYLPSIVLPMLPSRLSDDLCSLREKRARLAMTVKINYTAEGEKIKAEMMESVIEVNKNLHYEFVNEAIKKGEEPFTSLEAFARKIDGRRNNLELETSEPRLSIDYEKRDLTVEVKKASTSTKMIEIFMVAANEAVSELIRDAQLPSIYRCHPLPDPPDIEKFNDQSKVLGNDVFLEPPVLPWAEEEGEEGASIMDMISSGGGGMLGSGMVFKIEGEVPDFMKGKEEEEGPDLGTPIAKGIAQMTKEQQIEYMKPFRKIVKKIQEVKDPQLREISFYTILGMMGRAIYTAGNLGHFGLGSECYSHFTSPIRRYADVVLHRIAKGLIRGETEIENAVYSASEIEEMAGHCTDQTIAAEKLEYSVVGSGLTLYTLSDKWKGVKSATVSNVTGAGIFISLSEAVQGRIRLRDLTNERVIIDPSETMAFVSYEGKMRYENEITAHNWQNFIDEDGEASAVLMKLGDKLGVIINSRDYV
ncbi:MAG: RNB domain-containing ribonuclease, partial [Candidatus Kariarchaeaceae archaeon]